MSMFITWNIYYFNIFLFILPLNGSPLLLSLMSLRLEVIYSIL